MITQRPLAPEHRPLLVDLLGALPTFSDDERAVALEVIDTQLARPEVDGYRFVLSFFEPPNGDGPSRLAGYICYGRTPMTQSTYDLYWIATSPEFARWGVARGLVASMESDIAREGGGIVRVETGSRDGYDTAIQFYDALGFARTARIEDFYAPGDDLIIFTKRIRPDSAVSSRPATEEAALYDAAFGYRDHAAERDFLLACARRFGERDVRRVVAWACGPARHLTAFADAGVSGIGIDASEAMLAYAQRLVRARSSPPEIRFVRAALDERPDIPIAPAPVGAGGASASAASPLPPADLSFVPLSSIHQLATPEALVSHLRIAASLLGPGGLHVIEATHPADLTPSGVSRTEWTEVRGDQVIDARFRMHIDKIKPERVVPVTLEVVASAKSRGGGAGSSPKLSVLRQEDLWYIPDMAGWRAAVLAVPELKLAATLGDFNVDVPFEHAAAWRLILVLKRV
jgi:ribosomal protein S18 acetylase RimI-like enzyme